MPGSLGITSFHLLNLQRERERQDLHLVETLTGKGELEAAGNATLSSLLSVQGVFRT